MTSRSRILPSIALLAIAAFLISIPASATLGGTASSVSNDAQHLRASVRTAHSATQSTNYSVQEMQAAGATVREYVSGGKVFAVTWQGAARPNLRQLLGPYYARAMELVRADKLKRPGRHPIFIHAPDMVVQMGGHQRGFVGRAYVPNMMPSAVRAEEIR